MKLTQRVNYVVLPVILAACSITGLLTYQGVSDIGERQLRVYLERELGSLQKEVRVRVGAWRSLMDSVLDSIEVSGVLENSHTHLPVQNSNFWMRDQLAQLRDFDANIDTVMIMSAEGDLVVSDRAGANRHPFRGSVRGQEALAQFLARARAGEASDSEEFFYFGRYGTVRYANLQLIKSDKAAAAPYVGVLVADIRPLNQAYMKLVDYLGPEISMTGSAPEVDRSKLGAGPVVIDKQPDGAMLVTLHDELYKLDVHIPRANYVALYQVAQWYIGFMVLALTLVSFIAIRILIYRVVLRPITRLAESLERANHVDLNLEPLKRNDELGQLHNAYVRLLSDMHQLAFFDPLTGLANRRSFQGMLQQQLRAARRAGESLALMFIDLDNFKRVNDQFGHATGDELLRKFSQRIKESVRSSDIAASMSEGTLARLAGDEFALLLTSNPSPDSVTHVADRILNLLEGGFEVEGIAQNVRASIGIAMFPQDGTDAEQLLSHADAAMYAAKSAGRNRYKFFNQSIAYDLERQRRIEMLLGAAIEREEFELSYRPVFEAGTLLCTHFEVIAEAPSLQLQGISREEFVQVAESSGRIKQFDHWVLDSALTELKRLRERTGYDSHFVVDISAHALRSEDCLEILDQMLIEHRIDAAHIELNLRDCGDSMRAEEYADILDKIKSLGFRLGMSVDSERQIALTELSSMPLDSLRLPYPLLKDLAANTGPRAPLVSFVMDIARVRRLDIIVQEVPDDGVLDSLKQLGCTHVEGAFLSPALDHRQLGDHVYTATEDFAMLTWSAEAS